MTPDGYRSVIDVVFRGGDVEQELGLDASTALADTGIDSIAMFEIVAMLEDLACENGPRPPFEQILSPLTTLADLSALVGSYGHSG